MQSIHFILTASLFIHSWLISKQPLSETHLIITIRISVLLLVGILSFLKKNISICPIQFSFNLLSDSLFLRELASVTETGQGQRTKGKAKGEMATVISNISYFFLWRLKKKLTVQVYLLFHILVLVPTKYLKKTKRLFFCCTYTTAPRLRSRCHELTFSVKFPNLLFFSKKLPFAMSKTNKARTNPSKISHFKLGRLLFFARIM